MDNGGDFLYGSTGNSHGSIKISYWDACSLVALLGLLAGNKAFVSEAAGCAADIADEMVEQKRKRFS